MASFAVRDRLVVLFLLPPCDTAVVVLLRSRIEADGFGVVLDGLVKLVLLSVREAPVVERMGVLRVETNGLCIVGDCRIVVASLQMRVAAVHVRRGILF